MVPRGTHLLVEYLGCEPTRLDDPAALERALREAARSIGARVVTSAFHQFAPQGVTGMLLLEESHLSIHTWPEHGYAAVDLYTCGTPAAQRAVPALAGALEARRTEQLTVARGQLGAPRALTVLLAGEDGSGPVVDLGLGHHAGGEARVAVAALEDVDQELLTGQ